MLEKKEENTLLRSTASGNGPVASSGLGTKLWLLSLLLLSFFAAVTVTEVPLSLTFCKESCEKEEEGYL